LAGLPRAPANRGRITNRGKARAPPPSRTSPPGGAEMILLSEIGCRAWRREPCPLVAFACSRKELELGGGLSPVRFRARAELQKGFQKNEKISLILAVSILDNVRKSCCIGGWHEKSSSFSVGSSSRSWLRQAALLFHHGNNHGVLRVPKIYSEVTTSRIRANPA